MRFCDFFIDYKIRIRDVRSTIPWKDMPRYRQYFLSAFMVLSVVLCAIQVFWKQQVLPTFICLGVMAIVLGIFVAMDSKKKNQLHLLENHYSKVSRQRMQIVHDVMEKYDIDWTDDKKIDLLIEQAKKEKQMNDPFTDLMRAGKLLVSLVVPITAYSFKQILDNNSETVTDNTYVQIIVTIFIIGVFAVTFVYAVFPIIKMGLYRDGVRYDELVNDLEQLKIFGDRQLDNR